MRATSGIAVCLAAGVILFWNLGGYALWDPDEARYAEAAREMFAAADWRGWIVPSVNFHPYYDKPVLFYWLVSAAYALAGTTEWAARAVSAAAALLTVLAVYLWGFHVWSRRAGIAAALVLATAGEFVALGRYANLDMTLTLWVTLGVLSIDWWARRVEDRGSAASVSMTGTALSAALGMLTKGLVAPVLIGGIALAYLGVTRRLRLLWQGRLVRSASILLAVAGPWYLTAWLVDPDYLREFFWRHHVERFLDATRSLRPGPIYYYIPMLILCFFPWSVLLPATIRGTLRRDRRGRPEWLCVCWALVVFAFFSLASGKLGTYILPALPPLALLTGRYLSEFVQRQEIAALERRLVAGGVMLAATVFIVAVPVLCILSLRIYGGAWVKTSLLASVMIPVGVGLVWLLRRGRYQLAPIALGAGFATGLLIFYTWAAPSISLVRSEAPLAAATTAPIVAYCVRPRSLLFYVRRPVHEINRPRQLKSFLAKYPLVFVVTSPTHLPTVLEAGTLFPWHTGGRHVLYASRPPAARTGDKDG
jgi:4-amino-4-deoxy-L-arabinose transferase-like glycosyltransferase